METFSFPTTFHHEMKTSNFFIKATTSSHSSSSSSPLPHLSFQLVFVVVLLRDLDTNHCLGLSVKAASEKDKRFKHNKGTMDWVVSKVNKEMNISRLPNNVTVIFILGGPGSGKITQCSKITQLYGFTHISTSDLLRMEKESSYSQHSAMIRNKMNEGKPVPSDVMVNLLERAMVQSGDDKFLIDGFPCNLENIAEWKNSMGAEPEFLLYLDCSKEVMANRVLIRNEGREDDNMDTLLKRIEVFEKDSPSVVKYFDSKGKLRKIHAERSRDDVFEEIKGAFSDFEMSASC